MANRQPIEIDEWYHCYNRGVDRRKVFRSATDYERMLGQMLLAKHSLPIRLFSRSDTRLATILRSETTDRTEPIVEIGAYALMPNHVHFLLKEVTEGGIARFMQKVFTGYTLYFNQKNARSGALFAGTFRSKHVADDRYLAQVVSYVHLNPGDLFQPDWKNSACDVIKMEADLKNYRFSSLPDFIGSQRLERRILGNSLFELFDGLPSIKRMIRDARNYQ